MVCDWHGAFSFVLERILSGETTEIVLEQIQEYLTSLGNQVRDGQIPMEDFHIYKVIFELLRPWLLTFHFL